MILVILTAVTICAINFLFSIIIIRLNFTKEFRKFSKIILLSLTIRLIIMLVIAWIGFNLFPDYTGIFAITLISTFFILTMIEILYTHYRTNYLNLKNNN